MIVAWLVLFFCAPWAILATASTVRAHLSRTAGRHRAPDGVLRPMRQWQETVPFRAVGR